MIETKDYFVTDAKALKLNLKFDYQGMLEEAKQLKDRFVKHRPGSYDHQGWKSLALHGLSESHTGAWSDYGYTSAAKAGDDSVWTPAAQQCPITMDFLLNHFPCNRYARVRFMLLEAGGYIAEHIDSSVGMLENTNISLSNPDGCVWKWGDGSVLDMPPGSTNIVNIHYPHSIQNNSNEDRFHLIIHRHDCTDEWKELMRQGCEEQHVVGKYVNHEIAI